MSLRHDAAKRRALMEIRVAFFTPFRALVTCVEESRYEKSSTHVLLAAIESKFQNGLYGYFDAHVDTLYPEHSFEVEEEEESNEDADSTTTEELNRELLAMCEYEPENLVDDLGSMEIRR